MNRTTILLLALLLLLLAYPAASLGTEGGTPWLTGAALALLALGGVIPPLLRFTARDDQDEQKEDA
ncbi:hypothetical protein [Deinococcus planocerae]|uniref:hypothetical protein n=1 Tax=Deinococcus planocerae TaxID=1737569 RepID=UPI000C7E9A7D|nr:hypothetical protein [Deinococcus planocerae]